MWLPSTRASWPSLLYLRLPSRGNWRDSSPTMRGRGLVLAPASRLWTLGEKSSGDGVDEYNDRPETSASFASVLRALARLQSWIHRAISLARRHYTWW